MTSRSLFHILLFFWILLPSTLPPFGERGSTLSITDLLGAFTLVFCAILAITQKMRIRLPHIALGIYVILALLSSLNFYGDEFFTQSAARAIRLAFIVSPCFLFIYFRYSQEEIRSLIKLYVIASLVGTAIPLVAYANGEISAMATQTIRFDSIGTTNRAGGWVGDSSAFGHQIGSMAAVLLLALLSKQLRSFILIMVGCVVVLYGMYATSSRSALINVAASTLTFYFLFNRNSFIPTQRGILFILAILIISILLFINPTLFDIFPGLSTVIERLTEPFTTLFSQNSSKDISSGRLENWSRMFDTFGWSILIGKGYGSLSSVYEIADNVFIKSLGETGIFGLALVATLFLLLWLHFWRNRINRLAIFAACLLVGQVANAMFVDTLTFYSSMPPVLIILFATYTYRPSPEGPYSAAGGINQRYSKEIRISHSQTNALPPNI